MQKKIPKLQKISTLIWREQYEKLLEIANQEDKKIAAIIRKALNEHLTSRESQNERTQISHLG